MNACVGCAQERIDRRKAPCSRGLWFSESRVGSGLLLIRLLYVWAGGVVGRSQTDPNPSSSLKSQFLRSAHSPRRLNPTYTHLHAAATRIPLSLSIPYPVRIILTSLLCCLCWFHASCLPALVLGWSDTRK